MVRRCKELRCSKEEALKDVKMFVLDMDGTFYLDDSLIDGAMDFVHKVEETGRKFIFFTNNASRIASFYKEKLARMGLEMEEKDIVTAGDVTIEYLKSFYPGKKVYLNGTPLLEQSFLDAGIQLVKEDPDVVIQSFDKTLTYEKLERICNFIRAGVPFIATHLDTNCPTKDGFIPDCGAMCDLITSSTGVRPKFLGKPCKETLDMVLKITGCSKDEIAFVGDRIYTDVATGVSNGAKGFLVLTGEADMQTVAESDVEPTCIYDSLYEMSKYL
ncbi:MAG: HAD-IIA family hydrolase [Lachnospiraceae bacterium]|nr:HAD-IIA family hydrolase [Lachnospiraceae bacterium]